MAIDHFKRYRAFRCLFGPARAFRLAFGRI